MANVFISHVISDEPLMRELVQGLESAGYTVWFFERDVLPGTSYLIQIAQAMEACDAVVLLVTPAALSSDQVTKEVVGAFERRIPFIPVLVGVTPPELKEKQPEWRHALGGTAMLCAEEGLSACLPRVVEGLKALGIAPGGEVISSTSPGIPAPAYISDKILSTRASIERERKQVTVLFADVVGFTPLSEKLDPEEVGDLIRPAVDIMAEEIHRYEGTIAQFLGDGLMALFGAPLAHEDAPHRALYAALAIQSRLHEYSKEQKDKGIQFQMRIGINTGLVIVGRIRDDLTMEYTALGDTVNLASRMESAAEPGTVQVAESTYQLTRGYFDFSDLGGIEVKGKEEPVHAWRVLGALPTRGRVAASLSRGLSPFVGRERELDQLTYSYQQAKADSGQVVGMVGEPGVGKSRLLLQFRGLLPPEEYTYLEGGCIHYGEAIAYLPILGILRNYFDVSEGESEETSKQKMEEKLFSLDGQLAHILPPLQELLSLEVDDQNHLSLEPAQRRERVSEAIRYLLVAESQHRPLVLAVEDLHWIDKTSEAFMSSFIEGLGSARVLMLLLHRLEYTAPWTSKSYYSQVRVDHLTEKPSIELVQAILSEGDVSPEIPDFIVEKTAGNPLFIEELTRGLLEAGSIVKEHNHYLLSTKPTDIQVPDTIQGIITSRLDRLPEELKETLQVASVIGREFSLRLLEEVTGISKSLKSYLMQLQSFEFIYEKTLFPEPEYIFKHALTQEIAYNSLLLKRRREIHERIGQAIELLYLNILEEFYETLAYHYSHSEDVEKALAYLKLSATKAVHNNSHWEAVRFYQEVIQALDGLPESEENNREKMTVYLSMLNTFGFLGFPEGTLEIIHKAERLAEELGDDESLAVVYSRSSLYHSSKGDMSLGMEYSEKCFDLAQKRGDVEAMAMTSFALCNVMLWSGRILEMAAMSRSVIELLEEQHRAKDLFAGSFTVYTNQCQFYAVALSYLGEFEEGKAALRKGLEFALEVEDTMGVAWTELQYSFLCYCEGDANGAVDHASKAIKGTENTTEVILGLACAFMSAGHYILGDYRTAQTYAERGLEVQKQSGIPLLTPIIYYWLALARLADGDIDGATENAREALKLSREYKTRNFEAWNLQALGRIAGEAEPGRVDIAEEYIRMSIAIFDEMKAKPMCAQGHLLLGEVFQIAGRRDDALKNLRRAEEMYQEMGVSPNSYWLTRIREALASLEPAS